MLSNKEISNLIKLNAQLLELHDGNPFKIKTLVNAAFRLGRIEQQLFGLAQEELEKIEGIGKGIAAKIAEITTTGTIADLQELIAQTPAGVIDIMSIKGVGPKKVALIWKELEVETVGELLYACKENRLVDIKGFGEKTQAEVIKAIEFKLQHSGQYHYASIEALANELLAQLHLIKGVSAVAFTGDFYRKMPTISYLQYVVQCTDVEAITAHCNASYTNITTTSDAYNNTILNFSTNGGITIQLVVSNVNTTAFNQLYYSFANGDEIFKLLNITPTQNNLTTETELFAHGGWPYIIPEIREECYPPTLLQNTNSKELVQLTDLRGILHFHTTYSDGKHTLTQMATHAQQLGFGYVGVCDHSQSAFYANGLTPDRVEQQHIEIEKLNATYTTDFKIFKGIECDILNNGDLDYTNDILSTFDFVVASVHSNLKMNKTKATERVLRAIHNPYTTILGHPTGRLLLSRPGYELEWEEIFKACAAQQVVIEINAHPYRLDLDWTLVHQAQAAGCMLSINPDSHEMRGYNDLQYGVHAARKGLLKTSNTLNALNVQEFELYLKKKKEFSF